MKCCYIYFLTSWAVDSNRPTRVQFPPTSVQNSTGNAWSARTPRSNCNSVDSKGGSKHTVVTLTPGFVDSASTSNILDLFH